MSNPTDCASPPPNLPMSLDLARALAEAADGLAIDENPFYVVARYEPVTSMFAGGFVVWGPYGDFGEVDGKPRDEVCARTAGFFGPFQVTPTPASGHRVERVTLDFAGVSFSIDGREMPDALFLTPAAVEKFALPYYGRIFDPDFARMVKEQFSSANVQVMAHYPWSEYTDGTAQPPERVPNLPVFLLRGMPGDRMMHTLAPVQGGAVLRPVSKVG